MEGLGRGVGNLTLGSGHSLWGRKAVFGSQDCRGAMGYWQLAGGRSVPALNELTVCVALSRNLTSPKWTVFMYKQRGGSRVELGLTGRSAWLHAWLFGEEWSAPIKLPLNAWHTVCLTWSSRSRDLRLYVNGSSVLEARVNETAPGRPCCLPADGSLTLGASHGFVNGQIEVESGSSFLGEMSLFRMWGREQGNCSCAEGDVVRWDTQDWDTRSCPPKPEAGLQCPSLTWGTIVMMCKTQRKTRVDGLVYVSITPGPDVSEAQAHISTLLSVKYSNETLSIHTEPNSTMVNPVETLPVVTPLPPTSPGSTTGDTDAISSVATDIFYMVTVNVTVQGGSQDPEEAIHTWTAAQSLASQPCKGDPSKEATRLCEVNGVTGEADWAPPDLQLCPPVETTISDLSEINITANNSADMVDIIMDLVGENTHLPLTQLEIILDKLVEVVNVSQIISSLASNIIHIIEVILQHGSDLPSVTNQILNITDKVGDRILYNASSHNITTPSLVLSLVNVNSSQFDGLTFGVSSFTHGLDPKEPESKLELYTHVVSASITNTTGDIKDLENLVRVTLHHHTPNVHNDKVECVYWNFRSNGNRGGWDTTGCERNSTTINHTTCLCNHLTHFAVLVDISRDKLNELDEKILSVISYLGCGISSVFLGISLLTKLRRDYPSKILLNLSLALLGLNLVFLLNSSLSAYGDGLCVAVAAAMHYFTLASFTWMGLEAVHMYLALVKVFNVYVPSYIFKFCILGWGVPLVIVSTVLAVQQDAYGSKFYEDTPGSYGSTEVFCWVQHEVVFYVSVVAYVFLILICNMSVFGLVLVQIKRIQVNKPAGTKKGLLQDLRSVASLTFLLGLTWTLVFFSWGPFKVPVFYLFSILNSLQGFFLFVFYCLMKENVREQWRVHLCCGRFRVNEHSEWSRSMVAGVKSKPQVGRTPSMKSDDSNETRRTSSSSNPGQQQPNSFRISLGKCEHLYTTGEDMMTI
ncbi:adhesion G-protein coupled receptor G6-like [Conger conger]|uniref:adhesion G-protein coupled receptor G6-like n=1 Tax=Conger conger TaxID=82655 RepID=UPI002A5A4702|nr:adhesion G-protein coupled receptor G6-like [Conger conger]